MTKPTTTQIREEMERCLIALDKFGTNQDELRVIRTSSELELSTMLGMSICSCDANCSHEQIAQLVALIIKLVSERAENSSTGKHVEAYLNGCAAKHITLYMYQSLRIELSELEEQAKPSTIVEFRRKS